MPTPIPTSAPKLKGETELEEDGCGEEVVGGMSTTVVVNVGTAVAPAVEVLVEVAAVVCKTRMPGPSSPGLEATAA